MRGEGGWSSSEGEEVRGKEGGGGGGSSSGERVLEEVR